MNASPYVSGSIEYHGGVTLYIRCSNFADRNKRSGTTNIDQYVQSLNTTADVLRLDVVL